MSCFDCIHSTPAGCDLNRPEFETYADCAAFEWENQRADGEIRWSASSINLQKGDGDE